MMANYPTNKILITNNDDSACFEMHFALHCTRVQTTHPNALLHTHTRKHARSIDQRCKTRRLSLIKKKQKFYKHNEHTRPNHAHHTNSCDHTRNLCLPLRTFRCLSKEQNIFIDDHPLWCTGRRDRGRNKEIRCCGSDMCNLHLKVSLNDLYGDLGENFERTKPIES